MEINVGKRENMFMLAICLQCMRIGVNTPATKKLGCNKPGDNDLTFP